MVADCKSVVSFNIVGSNPTLDIYSIIFIYKKYSQVGKATRFDCVIIGSSPITPILNL